ncbi:efflux RND transporter permease subunit [Pseudobacteriovorax antillogorgiicola]|uniref:Cu(I)/Ag(I) efflux system membrane protein CusA/SilA n=1 Tax=Pseudobacteriovorax antillogorgiicola TaxID=1513793 RepID=A0A1Y6C7Q7_9BACT|nr:CusA/CzcA family heavy metal efflux RND transporter [Pseudobacteriovorax antillogorgiicola]TCS50738.1 Cu(I)/Ag(I) efflux system membrane protein CusA/SilA [Pseudobacteriovorax antillogorgiicola]SMF40995.1 Cu(I)/Ag(I) efflux system membrane protein CusA/SilA [Pseudobacteriovorax antillogorgiicola]
MIQRLIEQAIRNRILVVMIFLIIGLVSVFSIKNAKIDAIPDIGENQQIVFTEWPGRSPKDIEEQVTYPLSISLQGIPGVKQVRGISAFGFSIIYVIFKDDVDFYWSRSRVLEKLSTASGSVPQGVLPTMGPDATGLGQVYWYTIENEDSSLHPKSLAELRSIQEFYVRYLLQGVEGVSEVASIGGFLKEYQIDVDPNKLFALDIHFSTLLQAVKSSNIDVGAEIIEDGDREFIVRGRGFFRSLEDIKNVVIAVKNASPIRVRDVATVGTGPAFRRGALDKNGKESVGGVVTMRFGENPQEVINRVKERLEVINNGLPSGVKIVPFYDRTELIQKTMGTVYSALSQEILITVIVILVFLLHFRASILVSLTLPFGVGISFILMKILDIDSNVMSLSGMVIAIGSMVDMGIIMTENIYSHLASKPNARSKERIEIIIQSAREVGPAILTAVMTTIVTFLPVFALEGGEGKLFHPLAWAKTLAMFGSVAVAILLVPALSVFLLKGKLKPIEKNVISSSVVKIYQPTLEWVLEHRKLFTIAPIAAILLGALSYTKLGKEFMPSLNEGDILYMPVTTPDVSMTKARELLSYTDKILNDHPLVEFAVGKLGRADSAIDPAPVAMFETIVKLVPEDSWPEGKSIYDIMEDLDQELQIPGLVNSWDFPIQTRIGMISTGIKTQIGIKIFGTDLGQLERLAAEVGDRVEQIDGAYGVYAEKITGKPYIEFDIDRVAASRFGINTGTINQILQTAVGGMPIGQFYEGRERYSIRVRYKKELRDRIDDLRRVLVPSPLGQHIPLEQLANIRIVTGPAAIQSENGLLRSVVLLNVKGRDLIGFVEEARDLIASSVELPKGYSIVWAGQYENQIRANQRLSFLIPIALVINLFIIYFGIKNIRNSAIIFSAVPIAMAGGLILLWIGGFNTSVAVWVGFIALFGIAVDDGVVMMTYLQEAIKAHQPNNWESLKSCIVEAGTRRIRPLVMTTTTTVVALLPVMWSTSAGSEVMKPMAIPTLGGMLIALITLFVVPVTFSFFEQKSMEGRHDEIKG